MSQCQCILGTGLHKGTQCSNKASNKMGTNHLFCGIHQKCKNQISATTSHHTIIDIKPPSTDHVVIDIGAPPKHYVKALPEKPKIELKQYPPMPKVLPPPMPTPPLPITLPPPLLLPLPLPVPKVENKISIVVSAPKIPIVVSAPKVESKIPIVVSPVINFIGAGAYGCTYRPPLPCTDVSLNNKYGNNDYIMKLIDPESAKVELKMSKLLYSIDPEQKYFLYLIPKDNCKITVPIKELKGIKKCNIVESNFEGYMMKYGGTDLQKIIQTQPERITLYNVIKWLHKLIRAVQLLQSIHIIHYDIKGPNITIDDDNNVYLIDFGISWQLNPVESVNLSALNHAFYPIWPLFHNIISNDHKDIEDEYIHMDNNKTRKIIPALEAEFENNHKKYKREVVMANIFKVDIYSIGHFFMYQIYMTHKENYKLIDNALTIRLRNLLLQMINIDPIEQFNTKEAYAEATELMNLITF